MSVSETFTKPLRGRKPADGNLSPVAAALAQPVPRGLSSALEALATAKKRHRDTVDALDAARSPTEKQSRETLLEDARRALAKAKVAREFYHPEAPDAAGLAKLEADFDRAKIDVDNAGSRVESLEKFEQQCFQDWETSHAALEDQLNLWKRPLLAAVDEQLRDAMQLVAEAIGAAKAVRTWEPFANHQGVTRYPDASVLSYNGGEKIKATSSISLPADAAEAVAAAVRYVPGSRPPVAHGTEIRGIWDKR